MMPSTQLRGLSVRPSYQTQFAAVGIRSRGHGARHAGRLRSARARAAARAAGGAARVRRGTGKGGCGRRRRRRCRTAAAVASASAPPVARATGRAHPARGGLRQA